MRVLVVGGGGREHTLEWAIARSSRVDALFCAPGNAGTAALGTNLALKATDIEGVIAAAREHKIDLVAVGPEDPLAAGMVDELEAAGFAAFGPSRAAAQLEASKWFAKDVMERAGVATAAGRVFRDAGEAHRYIDQTFAEPPVIKADGLAAGKGVIVPDDLPSAHAAVDELLGGRFGAASAQIVIEERLTGLEASAMAFVDGKTVSPMPFSCDYKRALDGDRGPNTGGMGVYSPPGFLSNDRAPEIYGAVHEPVVEAMAEAQAPFRGILYAGLMVQEGLPGPKAASVVEFNCRFGDPETQVVLPQLQTDLVDVMEACLAGRLAEQPLEWSGEPTVGVVLASGGYPGSYETGKPVLGLDAVDADVAVFHAGTTVADDGAVLTAGGRVLTVVAHGPTLADARARAYDNAARIEFEGCTSRSDIALREL